MVGPPGVAVVDSKNWSYPVEVRNSHIYTGRFNRTKELDHLLEQVRQIEGALTQIAGSTVVRGVMALAGEVNGERSEEVVRGVRMMGVSIVHSKLVRAKGVLTPSEIDEIAKYLGERFPAATTSDCEMLPVGGDVNELNPRKGADRSFRFFYLKSWRKSGHHRLYLRSDAGADLGWKDVNSLQVELTCDGDDAKLAQAVLEFATPVGVPLPSDALPKVPIDIPGGRLIGWVTKVWMAVCIGQEWRKGSGQRLYGTLVDPMCGTFHLGYADLKTGRLTPSVQGNLSKDLGSAERYLKLIVDRQPEH
jgi:hypothetical protein